MRNINIYEQQDTNGTFYMMHMVVDDVQVDFHNANSIEDVYVTLGHWRHQYGTAYARFFDSETPTTYHSEVMNMRVTVPE